MGLLEECLEALGNHTEIIEKEEKKNDIVKKMIALYPATKYGQIDWKKIEKKQSLESINDLLLALTLSGKKSPESLYIIWSDSSLPIVKSTLEPILEKIDDVTAVSFDTWLYCPADGWMVELYHDGDITLGFQ